MLLGVRTLNVTTKCVMRNHAFGTVQLRRTFCSDSHDDFKPKRKDVPEGAFVILQILIEF